MEKIIHETLEFQLLNLLFTFRSITSIDEAASNKGRQSPVYKMMYKEMITDPIAEMQKMYRYYNVEFTQESERGLKAYLKEDPERRRKFGVHANHSMEHFGITHEMLRKEFGVYIEFMSKYTDDIV